MSCGIESRSIRSRIGQGPAGFAGWHQPRMSYGSHFLAPARVRTIRHLVVVRLILPSVPELA